jgi:hypothetical protein
MNSKLSGSITVNTNNTYWKGVNFNGTLTNQAGTSSNVYNDCYFAADPRLTDAGFLNYFSGNIPFEQTEINNLVSVAAGGSYTVDWGKSHNQRLTLSGSGSINLGFHSSHVIPGASYLLKIVQGSPSRTIIWPSIAPGKVFWPYGLAPILSGDNKTDLVTFYYDGSNYYGSFVLGY